MRLLLIALAAACLVLLLAGCTLIRYQDSRIEYLSVLQKKSLTVETENGEISAVHYSTDSNAAVELARLNMALAEKLAKKAGGMEVAP